MRAAVVSARTTMSASDDSEQVCTGAVPFELAAAIPVPPALDEYTW
jgi:hypothetical protein